MTTDADALVSNLVQSGTAFHDLEIRSASQEETIERLGHDKGGQA